MLVDGSGDEAAELLPLVSTTMRRNLDLFVTPTPPNRLALACMRPGGPLSDTNRNPTCGK